MLLSTVYFAPSISNSNWSFFPSFLTVIVLFCNASWVNVLCLSFVTPFVGQCAALRPKTNAIASRYSSKNVFGSASNCFCSSGSTPTTVFRTWSTQTNHPASIPTPHTLNHTLNILFFIDVFKASSIINHLTDWVHIPIDFKKPNVTNDFANHAHFSVSFILAVTSHHIVPDMSP